MRMDRGRPSRGSGTAAARSPVRNRERPEAVSGQIPAPHGSASRGADGALCGPTGVSGCAGRSGISFTGSGSSRVPAHAWPGSASGSAPVTFGTPLGIDAALTAQPGNSLYHRPVEASHTLGQQIRNLPAHPEDSVSVPSRSSRTSILHGSARSVFREQAEGPRTCTSPHIGTLDHRRDFTTSRFALHSSRSRDD